MLLLLFKFFQQVSYVAKLSPSFSSAGLSLALMLLSPTTHPPATRESTETFLNWKFQLYVHTKDLLDWKIGQTKFLNLVPPMVLILNLDKENALEKTSVPKRKKVQNKVKTTFEEKNFCT